MRSPGLEGRDAAVVDVGSNSVRLVIYRLEGRAIWTVFNEKVLAGLGRDLSRTGALSPDGVTAALATLKRFAVILNAARPPSVHVVATAAVRDARDGKAFVERVREETGLRIRILSGEEEAKYAALGVLAGDPSAEGLIGDLGGSSLELVRVSKGHALRGVTLPLGPFALADEQPFDAEVVRARANRRLEKIDERFRSPVLNAVGGAWRNLALIDMVQTGYPLNIVHQHVMGAEEATAVARHAVTLSRADLEKIPGISKKRAETLPYAAVALEAIIARLGVRKVVFSAYGLREGLLLESMPDRIRAKSPLIEGCQALGARQGVVDGLGPALAAWISPLATGLAAVFAPRRERVLGQAAARLADIAARLHPDHRADMAFIQVLRAPIAGWTHAERAFLAVAVHARYGGGRTPEPDTVERLLTEAQRQRAKVLGLALRMGSDLSGRTPALLRRTRLMIEDDRLVLKIQKDCADLAVGEQTGKRAQALAQALGRKLVIEGRKSA